MFVGEVSVRSVHVFPSVEVTTLPLSPTATASDPLEAMPLSVTVPLAVELPPETNVKLCAGSLTTIEVPLVTEPPFPSLTVNETL